MPTLPNPISKATRRRPRWRGGLLLAVGIVVTGYLIWAVGAYAGGWRGEKTQQVSRFVPLPVAMVGWQPLGLHSYLWHRATIEHYTTFLAKESPGVFGPGQMPDSRQVAMTKIIRDLGTKKIAADLGLRVSQTDLDQAFNAQLLQGGDRAETTKAIKELYDWTPEQFKKHVLQVAVMREKLREKISFDENLNANQRQQADRVMALVQASPDTFADLAKQYSEDVYGAQGGDLGFFPRGEHAKEIDDAVFNLDAGELSELVQTKFGWHILKVEEKKDVDGQAQVHARQIFIAGPSVDEYITTKLNAWGVRILLPEFSWDAKTGQVAVR